MRTIAIAGHTGRGKTTLVKKLLNQWQGHNKFFYDPNMEYGNNPYIKFNDFLKQCEGKTNTVIIFEEATINITNSSRIEVVRELLVRKRHTNNVIIFNFHSLRSIPLEIMDLIDYLILFTTNDREDLIYKKYSEDEKIIEAFEYVNEFTRDVPEWLDSPKNTIKNPDFCKHVIIKRF